MNEQELAGDEKLFFKTFVDKFNATFNLASLTTSGQWTKIWNKSFQFLKTSTTPMECLQTIRILSRDKTYLNETINEEQFDCLLNIANIGMFNQQLECEVQTEALKILCNLVFQSPKCQESCLKNSAVEGIVKRLRTYKDQNVHYDIKFFDMKLLFLITALTPNVRTKVRDDFHGLVYLVETVDLKIQSNKNKPFDDDDVNLLNEILKVLFNITVTLESSVESEEDDEQHLQRLSTVLHELLLCQTENPEKSNELISNIVNLLTNIPTKCYGELAPLIVSTSVPPSPTSSFASFEGRNVQALRIFLDFLHDKLCKIINTKLKEFELLPPILTVLIKCIRCCSGNRRFVRSVVLPPLHDVQKRPEEGDALRNHLCKLLTSPSTQISDLVAEFLFVLCKENVRRMIKHTGYGNAAGLFAKRGLLGGRGENKLDEYSSDSEDSDTEEYKEMQHGINPVLGCYEAPKANPMEGLSDEQKEYEAIKLVNLIDQLHKTGIVQPCKIGEDGRPVPVQHVLELQSEIPEQQRDHKRKS